MTFVAVVAAVPEIGFEEVVNLAAFVLVLVSELGLAETVLGWLEVTEQGTLVGHLLAWYCRPVSKRP